MIGHASKEESDYIDRLEASVDLHRGPIDQLLELGQLYIEPFHRENEAIGLFNIVLKLDPDNTKAKFWLAYCCLHYRMDPESLQRAEKLLESIIRVNPKCNGHVYMLLCEVLEEEKKISNDKRIELLETSVSCQPEWVHNRQSLAWAYKDAGRLADAIEQLQKAIENVRSVNPSWSIVKKNFEESITGRIGHKIKERLLADLGSML